MDVYFFRSFGARYAAACYCLWERCNKNEFFEESLRLASLGKFQKNMEVDLRYT